MQEQLMFGTINSKKKLILPKIPILLLRKVIFQFLK